MDIKQVLSVANRNEPIEVSTPSSSSPATQSFGLLSTTLVLSPELNFIIPIRTQNANLEEKNRVFFVYESHVELKAIEPDGYLRHEAASTIFGSRIRSAKALGPLYLPMEEVLKSNFDNVTNEHFYERSTQSECGKYLEQILVISLKSQELAFIRVLDERDGLTKLSICQRPLPRGNTTVMEDVGKFIAVASNSSAMAISAAIGNILLYSLPTINDNVQKEAFTIDSELVVNCDWTILNTEFLCAAPNDEKVHLLVIGSKQGIMCLSIYRWVPLHSLGFAMIEKHEQLFECGNGVPTVFASLKIPGSFVTIEGSSLNIYSGGLSNKVERSFQFSIQCSEKPGRFPGISSSHPFWTNLIYSARPIWNDTSSEGVLYIGREDGLLCCVKLTKSNIGDPIVLTEEIIGWIDTGIDTGLAIVDVGHQKPKYVIAAGVRSCGGIYEFSQIGAFKGDSQKKSIDAGGDRLQRVGILEDWSPLTDIVSAQSQPNLWKHSHEIGCNISFPDRLFTTSSNGHSGTLSELRYGQSACIEANFENPDFMGAQRIWCLSSDCSGKGDRYTNASWTTGQSEEHLFVLSLPEYNVLMCYIGDELKFYDIGEEVILELANLGKVASWNSHSDTDDDDLVLKVTNHSIGVLKMNREIPYLHATTEQLWPCDGAIMASIESTSGLILIANVNGTQNILQLKRLVRGYPKVQIQDTGLPVNLEFQPTCMEIFEAARVAVYSDETMLHDRKDLFAVMGSTFGMVLLFKLDIVHGISVALRYNLTSTTPKPFGSACESILALSTFAPCADKFELTILCGSRSGQMHVLSLNGSSAPSFFTIRETAIIQVGYSPIRIIRDTGGDNCAFLYCDASICHVKLATDGLGDDPEISSVWITDINDISYSQSSVIALIQPANHTSHSDLVAICGTSFLILKLDRIPRLLRCQTATVGIPNKMLYSKYLDCLVISTLSSETTVKSNQRILKPSVVLVQRDRNTSNFQEIAKYDSSRPAERFTHVIELFCESQEDRYHRLVASSEIKHNSGNRSGSIRYFNVSSDGIHLVKERLYDEPIHAICQFGKAGLVFSSGLTLTLQIFSFAEKRFITTHQYTLHSFAVYITCDAPYIFISTSSDSFLILFVVEDTIEFFGSDICPRPGIHHVNFPDQGLIMFADKFGSIVGLRWFPDPGSDFSSGNVFEASLPCSAMRLRKANVRPLWRQIAVPGVLERDILGVTADGSIIHFSILNEASWRFLKFIQKMCERNEILSYPGWRKVQNVHLESEGSKTVEHHVDGDYLVRLTSQSNPRKCLNEMLDLRPERTPGVQERGDFDSPERRRARFTELLFLVLKQDTDQNENLQRSELSTFGMDEVSAAIKYLKAVLEKPM